MKKVYLCPTTQVRNIEASAIIASSPRSSVTETDTSIGVGVGTAQEADQGEEAAAREDVSWDLW